MDSLKTMQLSIEWGNRLLNTVNNVKTMVNVLLSDWDKLTDDQKTAITNFYVAMGGSADDLNDKVSALETVKSTLDSIA